MNYSDTFKNNRILIVDDNPSIHADSAKSSVAGGDATRPRQHRKPCSSGTTCPSRPDPF